jgi:hypothetical protein
VKPEAIKVQQQGPHKAKRIDWQEARANADRGVIAPAPDFSASTYRSYRPALAEVKKLIEARDLDGLLKHQGRTSYSPNAIKRYRDIAIIAIKALSTKACYRSITYPKRRGESDARALARAEAVLLNDQRKKLAEARARH